MHLHSSRHVSVLLVLLVCSPPLCCSDSSSINTREPEKLIEDVNKVINLF
jgi:hypothetical protein